MRLTSVPSFPDAEGLSAEVEGLGEIVVDVAYGGKFYAIVEPQKNFRDIADHTAGELAGSSPRLRDALNAKYDVIDPEHPIRSRRASSSGRVRTGDVVFSRTIHAAIYDGVRFAQDFCSPSAGSNLGSSNMR